MNGLSLFPDLSKTTRSITPSKFKSTFENCPAFIPPESAAVNGMPFSSKIKEASLFKIICEDATWVKKSIATKLVTNDFIAINLYKIRHYFCKGKIL